MKITKNINVHNGKTGGIGIFDLFDDVMKGAFNLNDAEYDYICNNATDEELSILTISKPTFSEKRQMITIRNKYLNQMA